MKNKFFKKNINVKLNDILKVLNQKKQNKNFTVNDIKDLNQAKKMIYLFCIQLNI